MKEENLVELFIEELEELINKIKSIFVKIEQNSNDKDYIGQFRLIFHTIKGNSGFMGLKNLNQFSFLLETLFTENIIINAQIRQILQESINIIEKYIQDLTGGEFLDLEIIYVHEIKNQIKLLKKI